jgi:Asp-tRNA(Asn)/Glu-tRNA(Gln) amidotransferase A subunit family amidase
VFGKTNLSELAMSFAHGSSLAGPCRNPWDPRRSAGASSSGSACAVAAGIGPISIATDTGGSIRYPAALCGVVGFSPSSGRVPRHGNFGVNHFLVSIGVVARSVRDAANVLGVMSGPDPSDPSTLPYTAIDAAPFERPELPVLRVGRVRGYAASFCPAPAITALMEQALHLAREAGWSIAPVDFVVDEAFDAFEVISDCDRLALMCSEGTLTEERERLMSPAVVTRLKRARTRSGVDYARALEVRRKLQGRVDRLFEQFDLVVSPTVAAIAPLLHESGRVASDEQPPCDALWWTNLVGCPAASLPIGCVEGLPSAMHLVARPGADELLLVACGQLERELGYWDSGFPVAGAASPTCTHVRPAQASGVVRRCQ